MGNELAIIERQLIPLTPMFEQLLRSTGVPAARIIRSVLIACERTTRLLECTPMSVIQGATSFAVIGLEADGFTGQAFLIPFKDKGTLKAQPVVGYKGFSTIGARVGMTITGDVIREGDEIDYAKGTGGFVRHKPPLTGTKDRRILGAWAVAEAEGRPAIVEILPLDDILAVRDKSPAFRNGGDTPWKDPLIGFPAMAAKTARRRLARSLPLSVYQLAARMDEAHDEQGRHTFIHPDRGVVIDGEAQPDTSPERLSSLNRPAFILHARGREVPFDTIERWRSSMIEAINAIGHGNVNAFRELNQPTMDEYRGRHRDHVEAVEAAFVIKMQRSPSGDGERPPDVVAGSGGTQGAATNTLDTVPERAVVADPRYTKPELLAGNPNGPATGGDDGGVVRGETNARQTDPADGQPVGEVAGESPAPPARDPWFDNTDLSIKPPQRGNRPDWPAWSTLFFQKTAIASDGTDLALLIGSNETNINAFKAALGPMEAQHFDAAIARLYERLP